MKQIHIKIKSMLFILLMLSLFVGCKEESDFMEIGVVDMNSNVTSIDKQIVQPGDTVTFNGTGLDKVYKIMLNTENVEVSYDATTTQLIMYVPELAPLGDVITVNLFFSGKGLAQRAVKIISPPVIYSFSPAAAHDGDVLTVYGKELYLAQNIFIGNVDVTSTYTLIDDKKFTIKVPAGFTSGLVKIVTATGGATYSPDTLKQGTEILLTNFDDISNFYNELSSNGNLDTDTEETDEYPKNKIYTFTLKDNNTSWGGNVDFYTKNMPTTYTDNTIITLMVDIKLTKAMGVNVMIARGGDVWGRTLTLAVGWNHVVMKFSDMGSGYGSTPSTDPGFMALPAFKDISGIKIQPPASASNGNFGEKISVDNIKFIIAN